MRMKRSVSLLLLLMFCLSLFASCGPSFGPNNLSGGLWKSMDNVDITTGKLLTNKEYKNTVKFDTVLPSDKYSDFIPDVNYSHKTDLYGIYTGDLFHDQSEMFLNAEHTAEDEVKIKFRARKGNLTSVTVLVKSYKGSDIKEYPMTKTASGDYFDDYSVTLEPSGEIRWYIFKINKDNNIMYYTAKKAEYDIPTKNWGGWFILTPGFKTPEWAQGTVFYSIVPDSFYNADPLNDGKLGGWATSVARPWGVDRIGYQFPMVSSVTGADYYGGDLRGIAQKLDYIKNQMGGKALYTTPILESSFNIGYGSYDYFTINKFYGTNTELQKLTKIIHENNMKQILDGVWLFSSRYSRDYNKNGFYPEPGAFSDPNSIYNNLYYLDKGNDWPNFRTVYNENVLKINFETEFTKDYIYRKPNSSFQFFLREPFNIDGYRLDVPAYNPSSTNGYDVETQFRKYMKEINPDSVLIGETTVLPEELQGTALDGVWNYDDFTGTVYPYFGAQKMKPSDQKYPEGSRSFPKLTEEEFLLKATAAVNKYPFTASKSMYNILSSHDIFRSLTNLNYNVDHALMAVSMLMTMVGSPSIFYGDETGMTGHSNSMGNMKSFDWNKQNWNYEIHNTYKSFKRLREDYDYVLRQGGFMALSADNDEKIYSYARFTEDSFVIAAGNSSNEAKFVQIPVYKCYAKENSTIYDYNNNYAYKVKDGMITVKIQPSSYVILVPDNKNSGFIRDYETKDIGFVPVRGGAVVDANLITLYGSGSLGGINDNFRFIYKQSFGASMQTVLIKNIKGITNDTGLMFRESDSTYSKFVSASVNGGKIKVSYRQDEAAEVKTFDEIAVNENDIYLRIVRGDDNSYSIQYSADNKTYTEVYKIFVDMQNQIPGGLFTTGSQNENKAEFYDFSLIKLSTKYMDNFDDGLNSIYAKIPSSDSYKVADNTLTLKSKSSTVRLLSYAPALDFSVSASVENIKAGGAGLIIYQGEDNYLAVYKKRSSIIFESSLSGYKAEEARIENISADKVYFQIQSAGSYISAYYSTDNENWQKIGDYVSANFSEAYAGMFVSGKGTADFKEFTFGNINKGKFDFISNKDYGESTPVYPTFNMYKLKYGNGDWSYTEGGYLQSGTAGFANMIIDGSFNTDSYMVDITIKGIEGTGYAGIHFAKSSSIVKVEKGGYLFRINKNGSSELLFAGKVIAKGSFKLNFKDENRIRLIVNKATGIRVYANDKIIPLITAAAENEVKGMIDFVTNDAKASFTCLNLVLNFKGLDRYSIVPFNFNNNVLSTTYKDYAQMVGENGKVYEDFTMNVSFSMSEPNDNDSYFGFLIHSAAGDYPEKSGYLLYFKDGKIGIMKNNKIITEKDVSDIKLKTITKLEISVKDNNVVVKSDAGKLFEHKVDAEGAGAVTIVSTNINSTVFSFKITAEK